MHNLFFAIQPPPEVAARISALTEGLGQRHGLTGRPLAPERLHISLNSLGEHQGMPDELIVKASKAASDVAMPPFVVALDRVASFQVKADLRPVVIFGDDGVIGVNLLHTAIHMALNYARLIPNHERAIAPHLTLVRDRTEVPEEQIEAVSWRVREFVLIHSPYGEGRHNVLGRWRLKG